MGRKVKGERKAGSDRRKRLVAILGFSLRFVV